MLGLKRREETAQPAHPQTSERVLPDPWGDFARLRAEMDRLFGTVMGPMPRLWGETAAFTPAVDLYETADEMVMNAHLPGMSREDIHVEVLPDTIHVLGEAKPVVPEKDVTVHQAQGGYGRFDLRYILPVEVKPEEVKATYRNGMLEIRLPKMRGTEPKPVEVTVAG